MQNWISHKRPSAIYMIWMLIFLPFHSGNIMSFACRDEYKTTIQILSRVFMQEMISQVLWNCFIKIIDKL